MGKFKEFLNESTQLDKAIKFMRKEGPKMGWDNGEQTKDGYVFQCEKDINVMKLKDQLQKRFPDIMVTTRAAENQIVMYDIGE